MIVAHIHGVHLRRAVLQKHVRKSAGGSAHVQSDHALRRHAEDLQRFFQLQAAAADVRLVAAQYPHIVLRGNFLGGFGEKPAVVIGQSAGDQCLGPFPAGGQPAAHQRHVGSKQFVIHYASSGRNSVSATGPYRPPSRDSFSNSSVFS